MRPTRSAQPNSGLSDRGELRADKIESLSLLIILSALPLPLDSPFPCDSGREWVSDPPRGDIVPRAPERNMPDSGKILYITQVASASMASRDTHAVAPNKYAVKKATNKAVHGQIPLLVRRFLQHEMVDIRPGCRAYRRLLLLWEHNPTPSTQMPSKQWQVLEIGGALGSSRNVERHPQIGTVGSVRVRILMSGHQSWPSCLRGFEYRFNLMSDATNRDHVYHHLRTLSWRNTVFTTPRVPGSVSLRARCPFSLSPIREL